MNLLVYGNGFPSPFSNDMVEIRCGKPADMNGNPRCNWSPSNPDFETLARTSGKGTGIGTVAALADFIEKQAVDSIDELRILGHSSEEYFALAGKIVTDSSDVLVRFDEQSMIGETKSFIELQPRFHKLRDRFKAKGKVTLAGCGSGGTNSKLLDLASRTFLVSVSGFKRPIQYALNISFPQTAANKKKPIIGPGWFIANRGRVYYSSATLTFETVLGDSYVDTMAFSTDAWSLKPDAESNAGQAIVDAAKRSNTMPGLGALGNSTEVGWRILREFFHDKIDLFSGVRGDETFRGIKFEAAGKKGVLIVGKPYAQATNPATIDQRVVEMGELIKFAEIPRSGAVTMK